MNIPPDDLKVFQQASTLEGGGMRAFTAYMFADTSKKPRWDLTGVRIDLRDEMNFNPEKEYVPWVPLDWQFALAHASQEDATIIGGVGSSKTVGMAACGIYWSCMLPSFKMLACAPTFYQANQMYIAARDELMGWERRDDVHRPIHKYIKRVVGSPWPHIEFWNGSTIEFMSADKQGKKILTWSGDVIAVDQAESFEDLEGLIENLGTRTRGMVQDRERLGKLILLANSEYNPALWERFDMGDPDSPGSLPEHYLSIILSTQDNPYLSESQISAFERRIPDEERRRQLMKSERPMPRGKEFTPNLLEPAIDESLDEMMQDSLADSVVGYKMLTIPKAGTWLWETPPSSVSDYIMAGDPGQGRPPYRNSPCIMVFNVDGFPDNPARLAAFWWGNGNGSYWPFIYQFEKYIQEYRPISKGFDATGVQKGFDELVFQQRGLIVEGLNMQKWKQQMVVTLKLLLGKELIRMPKRIQGIWLQLANWHMPDRKLRQDIASTMFMVAFLLNRLYNPARGASEELADDASPDPIEEERLTASRLLHGERHVRIDRD